MVWSYQPGLALCPNGIIDGTFQATVLSPKTRFRCDDELEEVFQRLQLEIVKAIEDGVL